MNIYIHDKHIHMHGAWVANWEPYKYLFIHFDFDWLHILKLFLLTGISPMELVRGNIQDKEQVFSSSRVKGKNDRIVTCECKKHISLSISWHGISDPCEFRDRL